MSMEKESPTTLLVEGFVPKHNQRLDSVINKLKDQISASAKRASETETSGSPMKKKQHQNYKGNDGIQKEPVSDQLGDQDDVSNTDCKSTEDKSLVQSYLTWENNSNLCWLNASMSLLAHNKTLWHEVEKYSGAQIVNIMKSYKEAVSVLNDYGNESGIKERLFKARDILKTTQESVLEYLKPILKYEDGKPDSAFCSLLNLIAEDKDIENLFNVEFAWVRSCEKCYAARVRNYKKPIVTLSKVKTFIPNLPASLCQCPVCKSPDQNMNLRYKTLPQCLIFHFENGAGQGEFKSLDFEINNRKYKLSGLITLEKSQLLLVNHFVTWVRDVVTDSWLECNDLNSEILSFSAGLPSINLEDIYIAMFEALDNGRTIPNEPHVIESVLLLNSNDENGNEDIPVIDISDELKDTDEPKINNLDELEEPETNSCKGIEEMFPNAAVGNDSSTSTQKTLVKSEATASQRCKMNRNNDSRANRCVTTPRMKAKSKKEKQEKPKRTEECDSDCECHSVGLRELVDGYADMFLHSIFMYFRLPGSPGS